MLKRKRGDLDRFQTVYGMPPLESTLQFELGGDNTSQVGQATNIPISSGILGNDLFQYNRFFWGKNYFTFTHANCIMGLVFSYFHANKTYTAILPIAIPRTSANLVAGTLDNSLNTPNLYAPSQNWIRVLIYCFRYGLDLSMAFSAIVLARDFLLPPIPPGTANWPLLQNAQLPPVLFDVLNDGLQLDLRRNYAWATPPNDYFAWNLISLEKFMVPVNLTPSPIIPSPVNFQTFTFGTQKGWCGQGPYATGFGQFYQSEPIALYTDGYTTQERIDLWNLTSHPTRGAGVVETLGSFALFCQRFRLHSDLFDNTTLTSGLNCSLIPSRYFVTQSSVLSTNQKRPMMSNSPSLTHPNNIAVTFTSVQGTQAYQDATTSGSGASGKTTNVLHSGSNDSPVIFLRRFEAKNAVDLTMVDEWDNIVQNYTNIPPPGNLYDNTIPAQSLPIAVTGSMDHDHGGTLITGGPIQVFDPAVASVVPAVYGILNPLPTQNPNNDCFLAQRKIASMGAVLILPSTITPSIKVPDTITAQGATGMGIVHFGRILNTFH